jgi:TorA maturation chaperone TorD
MRDQGLDEAISAAGGVAALARSLGISQPSVSDWNRIPAERVLSVEAATGVARSVLRPDLFGTEMQTPDEVDEVDAARAREYALLATLLARSPDAALLGQLARVQANASPLGLAHLALADAAARLDVERVGREYFELFVGVGRGEISPYASYYLTGFLHARPLAHLRQDLRRLGLEREKGHSEPEDHVATVCAVMALLAGGEIKAPAVTDREFFETHMAPWIGRLFADLEHAETADFYARVGMLGRTFIQIETEAFALPS